MKKWIWDKIDQAQRAIKNGESYHARYRIAQVLPPPERERRKKIDPSGRKICFICSEWKDLSMFYVHVSKKTGARHFSSYCDPCRKISYVAKNLKIGITECKAIIDKAKGVCQCCRLPYAKPNIDHCHKTGKIRDVLCTRCNSALGIIQENTTTLRRMIEYIEKHSR